MAMCGRSFVAGAVLALLFFVTSSECKECEVHARTAAGWVCGRRRVADDGVPYASFRGVPYAKQPLGHLRFKELQSLEQWKGLRDATAEGPVCPQRDLVYGRLMQPQGMSEACIHANVHVPLYALPPWKHNKDTLLPIIVFAHGGVFSFGSGDADLYGPEYLVSQGVIVITFNYRLGPFGFLSLNSTSVPGNNGLRDMITLLQWVRQNARYFGGDPVEVTFAGHSAGGACVHLLSLCTPAEGLFKRILLMSGPSTRSLYTTSPAYSRTIANQFVKHLGINSTDPEQIHKKLIQIPLETIMKANSLLQDQYGVTTFAPVVESRLPGVTTIIDDDPEVLITQGRGANYTIIVGFCTAECETFRQRFEAIDMVSRVTNDPVQLLSPTMTYSMSKEDVQEAAEKTKERYFRNTVNMDDYIKMCSDSFIVYPALKLGQWREEIGGAPAHLYQFAYEGDYSVMREANPHAYNGTAHGEDLNYIFRANSMVEEHAYSIRDDFMKDWMMTLVTDFMICSDPICKHKQKSRWPHAGQTLQYLDIRKPGRYTVVTPTRDQRNMVDFFDSLRNETNVQRSRLYAHSNK